MTLRELRQLAFDNGFCYSCRIRPRRTDRRTCQTCHDNAIARRNRAADNGKCREQCGRDKKPGHNRCQECLDKRAGWARDTRAKASASAVPSTRLTTSASTGGPRKADSTPPAEAPINRLALIRARAQAQAQEGQSP